MRKLLMLAAAAAVPLFGPQRAAGQEQAVQVLLTAPQALRDVFPRAAGWQPVPWTPTAAQRATLESTVGQPLGAGPYDFLAVFDAARRFLGYALVTEEKGKYRPITFMVGITPDLRVQDIAVMVYRESRGGEVRSKRFLAQYAGKRATDPLQVNRDIINVTGATISVRSINAGVHRVLLLATAAFGGRPAPAAEATLRPVESLR